MNVVTLWPANGLMKSSLIVTKAQIPCGWGRADEGAPENSSWPLRHVCRVELYTKRDAVLLFSAIAESAFRRRSRSRRRRRPSFLR